jgi:hypothetical protein
MQAGRPRLRRLRVVSLPQVAAGPRPEMSPVSLSALGTAALSAASQGVTETGFPSLCGCAPAVAASGGGAPGHVVVYCNAAPGCRSAWYRPRCERVT